MRYRDRIRLLEASKDRFIDKNTNLSDEQKEEIKAFFKKYANLDGLIKDWQKAQNTYEYEDFYNIMKPYLDKEAEKEKNTARGQKIKDNFPKIQNSNNLSDEEKKALEMLFRKAPQVADEIDWDNVGNLTYQDFIDKFTPYQKDYIMKKGTFKDLVEGEDYIFLGKDDTYNYFYILTHKASRILGSNAVPPKMWWKFNSNRNIPMGNHGWYRKHNLIFDYPYEPNLAKGGKEYGYGGASWCIAMPHSDAHWRTYLITLDNDSNSRYIFAIANRPKVAEKKVAVVIDKRNGFVNEVVSGVTDAEVTSSQYNLMWIPKEQRDDHVACDTKIREFLLNNETYRKLFVTHEMADPMQIKDGNIYVNGKLVSKKPDTKKQESLEVDPAFDRLRESKLEESMKDRFIKNNPNLSDEQKEEIIAFFDKYNNVQSQIKDWDKAEKEYTYDDFYNIMKPYLERAKLKDKKDKISEYLKKEEQEGKLLRSANASRVKDPNDSDKMINPLVWNLRLFFRKAPQAYNDVDYDNLDKMTWRDWENVFLPYQDSLVKKGTMSDLVEGTDYELIGSSDHYDYYYIKTFKASWIMASNALRPKIYFRDLKFWYNKYNWLLDYPKTHVKTKREGEGDFFGGASWCLAMPHSPEFWERYSKYKVVFAIGKVKGLDEKKLAILCYKDGSFESITDAVKDEAISVRIDDEQGKVYCGNPCAKEAVQFINSSSEWKEMCGR